ncbi:MAG: divalent-cation tolerance protein CutA [Hyphomicrobiales bacterium]|nr:MAG: divalent-cation tolerance protein CutA [Hyphomicrobiales bacterium]
MPDHPVLVYSTFPDKETALGVGRSLVADRLCACVNILPQMISVYRWEGEVEEGDEVVMLVKTRSTLADAVVAAIVERHPYDVPAVLVLPTEGGNPAFCDWIFDETSSAKAEISEGKG